MPALTRGTWHPVAMAPAAVPLRYNASADLDYEPKRSSPRRDVTILELILIVAIIAVTARILWRIRHPSDHRPPPPPRHASEVIE